MASPKRHQHMAVFMVFSVYSRLTAAVLFYCSAFISGCVSLCISREPLSLERDVQLFYKKQNSTFQKIWFCFRGRVLPNSILYKNGNIRNLLTSYLYFYFASSHSEVCELLNTLLSGIIFLCEQLTPMFYTLKVVIWNNVEKNLFFLSVSNLTQIKQGPSSVLVCDTQTEPTVDPLSTYRSVLFSSC